MIFAAFHFFILDDAIKAFFVKMPEERAQKLVKDKDPMKALEELAKAAQKHKDAGEKANKRMSEAMKKVQENSEAWDVIKDVLH